MTITDRDFPEIRWHGHWIWIPEEKVTPSGFWTHDAPPRTQETHALFRKSFDLDEVPAKVAARISAESRYALFVNGREVNRGPIRSQPRRLYYDYFDLAPFLKAGRNIISVYVKYYGRANAFWMPATPNNHLGTTGILVFEADLGNDQWLVSDTSWKACKATAWSDQWHDSPEEDEGLPMEIFDARKLPADWHAQAFDDTTWGHANEIAAMHIGGFARSQPPTDPYGSLLPRPIGLLNGHPQQPATLLTTVLDGQPDIGSLNPYKRVQASLRQDAFTQATSHALPVTIPLTAATPARIRIDMGRIVSGFVQFSLGAPAATAVELAFTEDPLETSFSMDKMITGSRYTARGSADTFELFDSNGFRYAYLLIHGGEGSVTLQGFSVREYLYPWQEGADFCCSDDALNRVYQAGRRTVALCSHDAFIDCPTREQRAWVGDGVVHQMVHLATNMDWRLAWHFLTLGNSPRHDGILPMSVAGDMEARGGFTIPDWSLHWLHGVYNLYRFSGDRERVKAFLPSAERILRWYLPYQTQSGLLKDVPEWNLVDWSSVSTEDTSAILSGLWARGLLEFAEMAEWLGEKGSRTWASAVYERIQSGFEQFWDAQRGMYVDHIVDGQQRPAMSQIAGAVAIVSRLAPASRWPQIIERITDPDRLVVRSWTGDGRGQQSFEKWQNQVQRGQYDIDWDVEEEVVLAEPFMSYVVHDAIALANSAEILPTLYQRWSRFLVDDYDTIGECWDFGTHAHGWGCSPTRDMVFYTLGVTPAEPGYTKARIAPRLGELTWAKGHVPTPHGLISVEVDASQLRFDSPVPAVVDLSGQPAQEFLAGSHTLSLGKR